MSVLMEMHETHRAARARLGMPYLMPGRVRRQMSDLAPTVAPSGVLVSIRATVAEPAWGCPINMLMLPSPRFMIKLASLRHDIPANDIVSANKSNDVVAARDEAIALIWTHCRKMSLKEVGRLFNRDHSTILHVLRKMRLLGKDAYRRPPHVPRRGV